VLSKSSAIITGADLNAIGALVAAPQGGRLKNRAS